VSLPLLAAALAVLSLSPAATRAADTLLSTLLSQANPATASSVEAAYVAANGARELRPGASAEVRRDNTHRRAARPSAIARLYEVLSETQCKHEVFAASENFNRRRDIPEGELGGDCLVARHVS
jgi:hypothetical protein